jgi:hypothetical protein
LIRVIADCSRCYCEKRLRKLLILDLTESFVADESYVWSSLITVIILFPSYSSLNTIYTLLSINRTRARVAQSVKKLAMG